MTSLATQNGTKLWRTTALQKSNGKAIQQMSSTCCHHQRHGIIPWRNLRSSTAWEHISNKWRFKPIPRKGTTLMPSEAFNHLKWPMKQSIYIGKAKAQVQQWHLLTTQRPIRRLSCPPRERKKKTIEQLQLQMTQTQQRRVPSVAPYVHQWAIQKEISQQPCLRPNDTNHSQSCHCKKSTKTKVIKNPNREKWNMRHKWSQKNEKRRNIPHQRQEDATLDSTTTSTETGHPSKDNETPQYQMRPPASDYSAGSARIPLRL